MVEVAAGNEEEYVCSAVKRVPEEIALTQNRRA